MMLVLDRAEEKFADNSEDIYRCDNDRTSSGNDEGTMEEIGILE